MDEVESSSGQTSVSSGREIPSAPSSVPESPPVAMALPPSALVHDDDDGTLTDAIGFSWAPVLKSVAGSTVTMTQAEIDQMQRDNKKLCLWG